MCAAARNIHADSCATTYRHDSSLSAAPPTMAFVSAFFGTTVPAHRSTCRNVSICSPVRMTATSPAPGTTKSSGLDPDAPLVPEAPRVRRIPLKKGQPFNFVTFTKDDFEPKPYFDGLTGKGVKVAVLDSGCDAAHPALKDRIDTSLCKNYYYGSTDDWDDKNGHGTHVAGIILAEDKKAIMYGAAPRPRWL